MAGLDAEHAAKCRWTDHRAIGLRSDRQRHHACRHSLSGTRTTSRRASASGRVDCVSCPGWKIGTFVVTVLPMMTAPASRSLRTAALSASGRRPKKIRRTTFGRIVRGVEDVLDFDRNAVQRPGALATGLAAIERRRLRQRVLRIQMDESVDFAPRQPQSARGRRAYSLRRKSRRARFPIAASTRSQRSYVRRHRGSSAATASCPARNT